MRRGAARDAPHVLQHPCHDLFRFVQQCISKFVAPASLRHPILTFPHHCGLFQDLLKRGLSALFFRLSLSQGNPAHRATDSRNVSRQFMNIAQN
jgi:hypothetical protein